MTVSSDLPVADVSPSLAGLVERLLRELGEDPTRDGLRDTPRRVARSLTYLTHGSREDPKRLLRGALFEVECDDMVIVKEIDFFSLCEHHMLPFFGRCHVAYLPDAKLVGLSKIPRLVEVFSRRLQVQERLTQQIAEAIHEEVRPKGVAVVMEARHLCMMMRGVEKQNALATTSSMLGLFRTDPRSRQEFLNLIANRSPA